MRGKVFLLTIRRNGDWRYGLRLEERGKIGTRIVPRSAYISLKRGGKSNGWQRIIKLSQRITAAISELDDFNFIF